MFDATPNNLIWWLFSITQYADLFGITIEGDKAKLAISRLEKML